jgi:hypothetical protein
MLKTKSKGYGHPSMSCSKKEEPILQMETDKMIPRHVYSKFSCSDFLREVNEEAGFQLDTNGKLVWYTDSSKTN